MYLEIVDYPGEWLLDLPMLAQDYFSWSRQMTGLLNGQRGEWSAKWRMMCEGLDPLAPADENRLADIAAAWTDYLHHCKQQGCTLFSRDALFCPAIWQERPRCNSSHGQMSMPRASPNWRRPISTPMPECCASGLIITARKW